MNRNHKRRTQTENQKTVFIFLFSYNSLFSHPPHPDADSSFSSLLLLARMSEHPIGLLASVARLFSGWFMSFVRHHNSTPPYYYITL